MYVGQGLLDHAEPVLIASSLTTIAAHRPLASSLSSR